MQTLTMTITDLNGAVIKTDTVRVNKNKLHRIGGPFLGGQQIYELKKLGKIEIAARDRVITYEMGK